jgi:hypothetical protein
MLIWALTALFVLLTLGAVSLEIAMQSLWRARTKQDTVVAQNLAEAAADSAEAWLRAQNYPPVGSSPIDPLGGTQTLTSGTYRAQILPYPGNATAWRKRYTIVGTGISKLHARTSTVRMQVQQQSFALYSYFTDREVSSISTGTIWFIPTDRLYGPIHTNDQFHIVWSATATNPIFYGTVSSVATATDWNPSTPNTAADWKKVFLGGQDAFTTGTDYIALPPVSAFQKNAAWGAETGFPTTTGVYVPVTGSQMTGGIYVVGDSTVTFSANGTVGQTVSVVQSTERWDINTNLSGNSTTVLYYTMPSSTWVLQTTTVNAGLPNGVVYSTGNITSLSGTLVDNIQDGSQVLTRNAWTVCTDLAALKNITITGNIEYATHPNPDQPATYIDNLKAACLGIVGNDVIVNTTANTVRIDGTTLANGSFYNYYWNSGVPKGALTISGGLIQQKRGPVGRFSGSTLTSGYSKDYHYDSRMAYYPAPFFPTTGQFDILSWQVD